MIMEANDFWNVFQEWWNCSIIWSGFLQMILKPILWWSFSIYFSTSFLILIRNFLSLKNQIVKGMMAWNTSQRKREDNFQFPLKLLKIMNHESIYFWACKVSYIVCIYVVYWKSSHNNAGFTLDNFLKFA